VTVIAAGFDGGEPVIRSKDTGRRGSFVPAVAASDDPFAPIDEDAPVASWSEAEPATTAPVDRTFDDEVEDELDVPDFLK
jgi:cell division protein FtsZ